MARLSAATHLKSQLGPYLRHTQAFKTATFALSMDARSSPTADIGPPTEKIAADLLSSCRLRVRTQ